MSYPVILYPKLLVDFRRQHPLPCHQPLDRDYESAKLTQGGSDAVRTTVLLHAHKAPNKSIVSPTSPNFTRWLVCSSLVFGLLGLMNAAVPRFPQNLQQPIRVVSLLGAAVAIAGMGRPSKRDIKTEGSSSLQQPIVEQLEVTRERTPSSKQATSPAQNSSEDGRHLSRTRLLDYLEQLKVNLSGQVLQPIGASDAPVGRSEDAFASVLERYFPGRVKRQLEFPIPQSEKGRSFSTDFAVVLEEIGLYIDVEIDEPFDLKKKRPTHCIDDYHDRYRNGFFLQGNWIIIRFAEEQVVRYPKSCCREIASCVAQVTGLDKFLKPLAGEPILQPIPQWTKKQARALAKTNYRDTYLSLLSEKNST